MSKIVPLISLRAGVGRTSLTCLLATVLTGQGYRCLVIDNNHKFCDIENYFSINAEYGIDTIVPFMRSGVIDKETLKSVIVEIEKDLHFLAGSKSINVDNTLRSKEIKLIKGMLDTEYDFIFVDAKPGIEGSQLNDIYEIADIPIIVTQNKFDRVYLKEIKKSLQKDKLDKLENLLSKSYLVFNKVIDDSFKKGSSFPKERIFGLKYSPALLDYCNGYKSNPIDQNQKEIEEIVSKILNKDINFNKKPNFFGHIRTALNIG